MNIPKNIRRAAALFENAQTVPVGKALVLVCPKTLLMYHQNGDKLTTLAIPRGINERTRKQLQNALKTYALDDNPETTIIQAMPTLQKAHEAATTKKQQKKGRKEEPTPEEIDRANKILRKNPLGFLIKTTQVRVVGETNIIAACILSAAALAQRTKKNQIHITVMGASGKGKSSTQRVVSSLCWTSNVVTVTNTSGKSLYYASAAGALPDPCLIVFEEGEGQDHLHIMQRTLTDSSDIPLRNFTLSDTKEFVDQIVTETIATWTNRVYPPNDDQLLNRFLLFNTDGSQEADEQVFYRQQKLEQKGYDPEKDIDVQTARAIFWLLFKEQREVQIPFVQDIRAPPSQLSNRRSNLKFNNLIRASALLHYQKRQRDKKGMILAAPQDFVIARLVWDAGADLEATKVPADCLDLYKTLGDEHDKKTVKVLSEALRVSKDTVRRRIKRLKERGLIEGEVQYLANEGHNVGLYYTIGGYQAFRPKLQTQPNAGLMQAIKSDIAVIAVLAGQLEEKKREFLDSDAYVTEIIQKYFEKKTPYPPQQPPKPPSETKTAAQDPAKTPPRPEKRSLHGNIEDPHFLKTESDRVAFWINNHPENNEMTARQKFGDKIIDALLQDGVLGRPKTGVLDVRIYDPHPEALE